MKSATKRFSLGIKIASILTCLVVAAVGFASWLIVKPAAPVTESGSFTVNEVETVNVQLSVTPVKSAIVFGKPATLNKTNPWLRASDDMAAEALTAQFDVTVDTTKDNVLITSTADKFDVTFNVKEAFAEVFNGAIGEYIAAPVVNIKSGDTVVATATYNKAATTVSIAASDAKTQTFTVEIVFDWGTITGGANPYEYFNDLAATDENVTKANTFLTKIYEITSTTSATAIFDLTVASVSEA